MTDARALAVEIALEAGEILLSKLGQVRDVRFKGVVDLVTEADELSEQHILRRLRERFPDHQVLAEESGASGTVAGAARWLVDPLDGTINFAHGYPIFAVSIALEVDDEVQLGVVYVPTLRELFVAERGKGATLNGEPIAVSQTDSLIQSLVATGFLYDVEARGRNLPKWEAFVHATQGVRRDGSAAIDLCYVAAGRYDGYWEEGLSPWDTGAGTLMVAEAGGTVTDYEGAPYRLSSRSCVASNGKIHGDMLDVLARAGGAGY